MKIIVRLFYYYAYTLNYVGRYPKKQNNLRYKSNPIIPHQRFRRNNTKKETCTTITNPDFKSCKCKNSYLNI